MFVKPAKEGLKIFDPATKLHLSDEGKKVPRSNYWIRRVRDGEVVEIEETKKVEKKAKTIKEKSKKITEVES